MACKVKSKEATRIDEEIYAHFADIVEHRSFRDAISNAAKQLSKGSIMEKRVYGSSFSLRMKRNMFGLYTIEVALNHRRCRFLLDSGAQISGIRAYKAKELALPKTDGSLTVGSIGGTKKELFGCMVESLHLGGIEYLQRALVVLSDKDFALRFAGMDMLGFDGILGWDILSQLDFELDDIAKRFKVIDNHWKLPNPNMLLGGFPCLIMQYEDQSYGLFGFDSGSKHSWFGEAAMRKHCRLEARQKVLGMGVHGLEKLDMSIAKSCRLYLDKASLELKHIMSGPVQIFPNFVFDGVLGNEIFAGRRIRFINSRCMVLLA